MRRLVALIAVFALESAGGDPLRAGVYNPAEGLIGPAASRSPATAMPFPLFKSQLADLANVGLPLETPLRTRYVEGRDRLKAKRDATPEDEVSLSAYHLYLRDPTAAIDLLAPLAAQGRQNFIAAANLMSAYQQAGQMDRAAALVDQMRGGRPSLSGLTKEQADWLARVETYHQKLVNLRYRESLRQPQGRPHQPETVDNLFGVRFVGDGGRYEPGKLAADQKAILPADAVAVVQQLLVWLPDDTRLYWLLGELYNAQGDLERAAAVFDDCRRESGRRFDAAELREHRQVVQDALASAPPPTIVQDGVGAEPGPASGPADWMPDRRHLALVGGAAGLAVAFFVFLQVREVRRRHGGKSTAR
jgi:hypothetical protein